METESIRLVPLSDEPAPKTYGNWKRVNCFLPRCMPARPHGDEGRHPGDLLHQFLCILFFPSPSPKAYFSCRLGRGPTRPETRERGMGHLRREEMRETGRERFRRGNHDRGEEGRKNCLFLPLIHSSTIPAITSDVWNH